MMYVSKVIFIMLLSLIFSSFYFLIELRKYRDEKYCRFRTSLLNNILRFVIGGVVLYYGIIHDSMLLVFFGTFIIISQLLEYFADFKTVKSAEAILYEIAIATIIVIFIVYLRVETTNPFHLFMKDLILKVVIISFVLMTLYYFATHKECNNTKHLEILGRFV